MKINMVDTLYETKLEKSGYSLPMGAERAKDVFDNYMGSQGRNKNLGVYYCFLAWEEVGTQIGWTRRLDKDKTSGGDSSGHKSSSNGNGRGSSVKGSISSDQSRITEYGIQLKHSMDNIQSLLSPSQTDKNSIGDSRSAYYNAKANVEKEIVTDKVLERLEKVINGPMYALMSEDQRSKGY